MPRQIANHAKPRTTLFPKELPSRSLRTCFLAALMIGIDGTTVTLGQETALQGFELEKLSNSQISLPTTDLSAGMQRSPSDSPVVEGPLSEGLLTSPPSGLIESASDYSSQNLPGSNYPYPSVPPAVIIPRELDQASLVSGDDENLKLLEPEKLLPSKIDLYDLTLARYTSYRSKDSAISYMPGDGDQFGWLSFVSSNYLERGSTRGATANMNIHLLSGPGAVPLPPRLYDFQLGYQARNSLSGTFSYDCAATVGVYSDFEDSARDGVRFPAHAVGMFHPGPRADWVFGVDYLGRDDIKLLPVAGLVWHDPQRPELRYEMVFPRPRVDWTLSSQSRVYCSGLLGGGTWDIEFPDNSNDVMTYRDYQLAFGLEQADSDGGLSSWEFGWIFSRKLEFRDRIDEYGFGDAFVIRYVARK